MPAYPTREDLRAAASTLTALRSFKTDPAKRAILTDAVSVLGDELRISAAPAPVPDHKDTPSSWSDNLKRYYGFDEPHLLRLLDKNFSSPKSVGSKAGVVEFSEMRPPTTAAPDATRPAADGRDRLSREVWKMAFGKS